MRTKFWLTGLAVAVTLMGVSRTIADDKKEQQVPFGALQATGANVVKARALAWLQTATRNDAAKLREAENIWARSDRSMLDNLADTFAIGNGQAAELLRAVRDPSLPPPTGVPAIVKDASQDTFFRNNLGLAVARHLSNNRVHEEALAILNGFTPEQTVDPSAYLFHRAICEHALLKRDDAENTVVRLLHDAVDSPDRYKTMAALILLDMETWRKDLGNVARLMNNSERRLDVGRAGPQTQKIQREVIARLDEMIKELENQAKRISDSDCEGGGGDCNGGSCPDGSAKSGNGGGANPKAPMQDSRIATNGGSGRVDVARLQKLTDGWGKLPATERAKAMQEIQDLVNGLSPIHREAFERYFEEINNQSIRGPLPIIKQ